VDGPDLTDAHEMTYSQKADRMATFFLEFAFWYHLNLSTLLSDSEAWVAAIVSLRHCASMPFKARAAVHPGTLSYSDATDHNFDGHPVICR
jgi:hypothetical protein